tara:strand:+ start:1267 stop:1737 length:471 start_codon:yes stop_codon:yes gene_type:complete
MSITYLYIATTVIILFQVPQILNSIIGAIVAMLIGKRRDLNLEEIESYYSIDGQKTVSKFYQKDFATLFVTIIGSLIVWYVIDIAWMHFVDERTPIIFHIVYFFWILQDKKNLTLQAIQLIIYFRIGTIIWLVFYLIDGLFDTNIFTDQIFPVNWI